MSLLWFLLIGLAAGWLAGQIMKGGGFGLVGDLIVGVIGALLGGFLRCARPLRGRTARQPDHGDRRSGGSALAASLREARARVGRNRYGD